MLVPVARRSLAGALRLATRSFSAGAPRLGGDHHGEKTPIIQGPGAKPGTVPTDLEQATGIERFELLARMKGEDPFDNTPLKVDRLGTLKDPIMVYSLENDRLVGCTGFPVDSHDPLWFRVTKDLPRRCSECGCAYKIDYQGNPDHSFDHTTKHPKSHIHTFEGEKPRIKWGWADTPTADGKNMR